jgi:hypothetical protein
MDAAAAQKQDYQGDKAMDAAAAAKLAKLKEAVKGKPQTPPAIEGAKVPATLFVIDTTALPAKPPREHEMIVDGLIKVFKFEPTVPLELPIAVAIKFLKHAEFKRTNKDGELQPYHRRPKQPDELKAGERFTLGDHQTVALYSELTNVALFQRAMELPRGEMLPDKGNRQALIDFIAKAEIEKRKANAAKQGDLVESGFVPEPEVEHDADEF